MYAGGQVTTRGDIIATNGYADLGMASSRFFNSRFAVLHAAAVLFIGAHCASAVAQNANLPSPAILPTVKPAPADEPRAAVSNSHPISASDRLLFLEAMEQADRRRWRQAQDIAAKAESTVPRKIIDWIYMRQPGAHVDFQTRADFISANPDWPLINELRIRAEQVIDDDVPATALNAWFAKYPPLTDAGKLAYALALRDGGNTQRAADIARQAWVDGISGRDEEQTLLREFGEHLNEDDHWERIDRLLYIEYTSTADRSLRYVSKDRQLLARARIALVTSRGGVDASIARVPEHLQNDAGLLYDRVRWRRQRGRYDDARELIPDYPPEGPRPDLWWRERHILARDALSEGKIEEAYEIARHHGASDALSVSEAEWLAGWIALRYMNDGEKALPHFEKVYDSVQTPISLSRGAYWTGRAAESLGRPDIAEEWYLRAGAYPTTYYGQLAISRLKDSVVPQLPQDPTPTAEDRERFETNDLTHALQLLLLTDEKVTQRRFAQALAASTGFGGVQHLTAELASRLARPDIGVWVARQSAADKITLVQYGYPIPFYNYPDRPERALILGISRQESNFDPTARSGAGARGVMQLMPATARAVARAARIRYSRDELTDDPALNIQLGSAYLSALVDAFDGSYILAAAGYNAGPNRARRWIREFGDPRDEDVDAIDWVEKIPFSETRNYVQRVMENLTVYRSIIAGTRVIPQDLESALKYGRPD